MRIYKIEMDLELKNGKEVHVLEYGTNVELYNVRIKYNEIYSGCKREYWLTENVPETQLATNLKNIIVTQVDEEDI